VVGRVLWLARGLHRHVTGIERFVIDLMEALIEAGVLTAHSIDIVVDSDAEWTADCVARGARRFDRPPSPSSYDIVHNFGADRFPRWSPRATRLYSVYDWGPWFDRTMRARARTRWAYRQLLGVRAAGHVHVISQLVAATAPWPVAMPSPPLICPPVRGTGYAGELGPARAALFVGTADRRKRLDLLTAAAASFDFDTILVGQGTDEYTAARMMGLGRCKESQLHDLYATASCLFLVSDYEGFGIPVVEAASRGVMSVVSQGVHDALPSVLRDFCLVADPRDPLALREAAHEAMARRGSARWAGDLMSPLVEHYRRSVA
jgi:glycosyltransferase involved in cell wall biosynthesis